MSTACCVLPLSTFVVDYLKQCKYVYDGLHLQELSPMSTRCYVLNLVYEPKNGAPHFVPNTVKEDF